MNAPSTKRTLLLGHRGARAVRLIRENTPACFDRALSDGCDGFEFDVRLTADGEAVIWHDPTSNGLEIALAPAYQLAHLCRLKDVISGYGTRAFLDIELKVSGMEKIVVDLLHEFPPRAGLVVSSFLPQVLLATRAADPGIPLGLICETEAELSHFSRLRVEYLIAQSELLEMLGPTLVQVTQAAGKKILVWTANTRDEMLRLRDLGVDGIISDQTKLLAQTLGQT